MMDKLFCFLLVLVSVVNIHGQNPVFTHPEWPGIIEVSVTEDEPGMTPVAQISADGNGAFDAAADPVYYYVKDIETMPKKRQPPFTMDSTTGILYLQNNHRLEYDDVAQYRFTICAVNAFNDETCGDATDRTGDPYSTPPGGNDWIVVNVLEVTSAPVWDIPVYNISLLESAAPSLIHYATATDPDPKDRLRYSIASTSPAGGPFSIDPDTGEFFLTGALDHESVSWYDVITEVDDGRNPPVQGLIHVKVINENEAPVITNVPASLQIEEDQDGVNQYLFTPLHSDPDGDTLTFNLTCIPTNCPFYMNGLDQVFLDDSVGVLDWEVEKEFRLIFTAFDGNVTVTKETLVEIININEPPWFINIPANWSVLESETIGRHVFEVWVGDPENDTITYHMITNPRDSAGFTIDQNGVISFPPNPGFNHDLNPSYTLSIFATDGGIMIGPETIDVEVVDVNEPPKIMNLPLLPNPHRLDMSEAQDAGSQIMRVITFDPDRNETFNYSLLVSPVGGNGMLDIDKDGYITIGADGLDFESGSFYTVQVTVIDSGGLWDQSYFHLTVDDHPEAPVFRPPETISLVFTEEQTVGDALPVLITATDEDIGDTLTYTLVSTPGSADFTLDTSGASPVLRHGTSVDYDTTPLPIFYSLKLLVTDSYGLTDWMWVDITYVDTNDNTPAFTAASYTATIEENLPIGASVLTVSANDLDIDFDIIYYSIDPTDQDGKYFDLDPYTGVLTIVDPPDFETVQTLSFGIIATDNGGLTTTSSITVHITDQNDNAPYFLSSYYNYEVRSDAWMDYAVGPVQAADVESGSSVTYDLDDPSGFFKIDASSGMIYAKGPVDVDETYTLHVTAWDQAIGGGGALRSIATTVRVDSYLACEVHMVTQLTSSSAYSSAATRAGVANSLSIVFDNSVGRVVAIDGVRPWLFTGPVGSSPNVTVMWLADATTASISSVDKAAKDYVIIDKYQTKNLDELINYDVSKTEPAGPFKSALTGGAVSTAPELDCPPPPKNFWTETAGGIFTQSLLAILGIGGLGALLSYGLYRVMGTSHILRAPWKCKTCYRSKWVDDCICRNQCRDNCCPPKEAVPPPKAPPKVPDNAGDVNQSLRYHRKAEQETIFRKNRPKPERTDSLLSVTGDDIPLTKTGLGSLSHDWAAREPMQRGGSVEQVLRYHRNQPETSFRSRDQVFTASSIKTVYDELKAGNTWDAKY